jgi:putative FmdB family regulatory protein
MPTYDYECEACGHAFELFQSMSESVKRKCPECGRSKLQRLIGRGAAVLFKGSGFYETDYRSESYKAAAKTSAAAETPTGDAKSDTKADKPDAAKSKPAKNGARTPPAEPKD